jgi:acetyl esterase/lipase
MNDVLLHAEIIPLLEAMPPFAFTAEALPLIRQNGIGAPVELSDDVERTDHVVSDDPRVVVRVHRAKNAGSDALPGIYSIHGGGYIVGSYEMDDARFDRWCPTMPCVGVSVEYRLAPETPYPGPLEDCYAGLRWMFEHAGDIGVDRERIGIAGISAGGGLAAALALLARDRGEVPVAFQLLECPMIDDRQVTSSSQLDGLPIWSRESNEFGWRSYLGDLYGTDDVPPYAAPARAVDLAGLPPALVIVGGADGFRDEDIDYAMRLNQAGVPTELHVLPGGPHGVQMFPNCSVATRWAQIVNEWVALELDGAPRPRFMARAGGAGST